MNELNNVDVEVDPNLIAGVTEQFQNIINEEDAALQELANPTPVKYDTAQPEPVKAPEAPGSRHGKQSWERDNEPPGLLQNIFDALAAPGTGLNDYVVDELNKLPFLNLKKRAKFENEAIQQARELSSFIIPNIVVGRAGMKAGAKLNTMLPSRLQNSAALKAIGGVGMSAGTGAYVDYTNKLSQTDDNLVRYLKDNWPKTYSRLPEDWATLDTDSPDVHTQKNIITGAAFGIFNDLLLGAAKLARGITKTRQAGKYVSKGNSAQDLFDKLNKGEVTPEEAVINSAKRRDEAIEELRSYYDEFDDTPEIPKNTDPNVFEPDEMLVREADPGGVYGAAVDAVRIQQNLGTTHGRLRSIVSEAALKYGIAPDNLEGRALVNGVKQAILEGGDYDYMLGKKTITAADRDAAAEVLSEMMMDPRMEPGMLKKTLDSFRDSIQTLEGTIKPISQVGYEAVFKSIRKYMDEYMNMDTIKAQAYLTTSISGQVSDMAEGVRYLTGPDMVTRAQEMILDRLEFLLVEKGLASYQRGAGLANLKLWDRARMLKDPDKMLEISEQARARSQEALADLIPRSKTFVEELKRINDINPDFLKPLTLAWEFSDGSVDTLDKLNRFMYESLGKVSKAFIDENPEMPNVIVQGMWSNLYNSFLTSVGTPSKAAMGNAVMMLTKPVAIFAGSVGRMALGEGDAAMKTIKRGWYQYSAVLDTFQKGASHLGHVFRKASMDPTSVSYVMRPDLAMQNDFQMDALLATAEAYAKQGNDGPLVLWHHANELRNLANNPILRFGANAMSALDGFTRAVEANVEARGRAWDAFIQGDKPLNGLTYKEASDNIYADMFGKDGFINDETVEYNAKEMALSLDNAGAEALGAFIARNPAVKPFLLFPKTAANVVSLFDKFSPASVFQREYNDLAYKNLNQFTQEEMIQALKQHKRPIDEDMFQTFATLRAEVLGRKAIGTTAMMMSAGLFLQDRIHGNGHFDKTVQRNRRESDWQPRSIKGIDGKWYSYDGLGPISDWLALSADVMDNFDVLAPNDLQTFMNRLGFLLSANLSNKSMLAPMEPMFDVLSGNASAITRFGAQFANAAVPLAGARGEFSKIISPQLREFEETFTNHLRNRNRFMDAFGVPGELANKYDWIDGGLIGYPQETMTRLWNAVAPFKIRDGISPEKQYLIDVEYDARAQFTSNRQGARYTDKERSELLSLIGQQGNFKRSLQEIMKEMPAEDFRSGIKKARAENPDGGVDPKEWANLYNRLDDALLSAKRIAEATLSNRVEVDSRGWQRKYNINEQRASQTPTFPLTNK